MKSIPITGKSKLIICLLLSGVEDADRKKSHEF